VVGLVWYSCCSFQPVVYLGWTGIRVAGSLRTNHIKLQNTWNQEQYDQYGNSTEKSQAPDDGYINVRNMFNT